MLTRLSVLYPLVGIALALNVPRSFENTNVVRTIELGGSLSLSSTVYQVRALKDGVDEYTVTLSKAEGDKTSWVVPKLKDVELTAKSGFDAKDNVYYYTIKLPTKLKRDETTSIIFGSTLSHASPPLPEFASQTDPVRLKFEGDMLLVSPYETLSQKTKLRAPTPQITAYEDPEPASTFVKESQVTKSGSTVTYGPFGTVPASASQAFQREHQRRIGVQYDMDVPVTSIVSLQRSAEISHWGANLNIQDDVHLVNGGPKLKGHFSRIDFQHARFYGRPPASTIASLHLALPAGIRNPYFYDQNGNVSTSRFRPSPSVPQSESPFLNRDLLKSKKSLQGKYSSLELTPRYPLLGGWNYTFTLGWDAPLADWGGASDSGKYVVAVPFLNTFKDTAVDTAELKIVLPEGATDVSFETPFAMDSVEQSTLVTYLDTVGRPVITMRKAQVTDKHDGIVYVSYRVPFSAHLKKPLAVATAMMSLFALGFVARRVDMRIHTTKGGKKKL